MSSRSVRSFVPVVAACWLSGCAETSTAPPASPTPLPTERIGVLALACPAGVQTQSLDGQAATVDYELPHATGGQDPVTVNCSPEPGHSFEVGRTEVSCSASDRLQQAASCTFLVTVHGPPKLSATRFVAFGDGLTAGWVSSPAGDTGPDPASAYPQLLQRDLQSRYVTQTIQVVNAGAPGEQARNAISRFRSVIGSRRPKVVLLMEGTNDLDRGAEVAADALEAMVRHAQQTGAEVLLMTVPPQVDRDAAGRVGALNGLIESIAVRTGAVLVDVHDVLLNGPCSGGRTTPCIGGDGLHPTAEGYRLIVDELTRIIVDRYDVDVSAEGAGRESAGASAGPGVEGRVSLSPDTIEGA